MLKVTISGSYRKFPNQTAQAMEEFKDLGAVVLSPPSAHIISSIDGFVSLQGDLIDPAQGDLHQAMKAVENAHLRAIQNSDVLYVIMPDNYLGPSALFEIGFAVAHNIPVYAQHAKSEEPIINMYINRVNDISEIGKTIQPYFNPLIGRQIMQAARLNASVAAGAIVEDHSRKYKKNQPPNLIFVNDENWDDEYTLPGVKRRANESLSATVQRALQSRLGVSGSIQAHIITFGELTGQDRIFIDYLCQVHSPPENRVNSVVIMPAEEALRNLPLEPNARKTLEEYAA